jgi:YD repeat-containing protein
VPSRRSARRVQDIEEINACVRQCPRHRIDPRWLTALHPCQAVRLGFACAEKPGKLKSKVRPDNGLRYDANGNLTSKAGEATYTWDFENRLIAAYVNGNVVEHVYDADGNRTGTTVNGVPTNYLVDSCGAGSCNGSLSHVVAETNGIDSLTALYIRLGR